MKTHRFICGNKNSNNIGVLYRGIHPSFLGRIDLTVCGNSDPGTSGLLTPFGKMDGLYFDGSDEPDDFKFDFKEAINKIVKRKDVDHITLSFETREDYYKMMNMLRTWNDLNISAYSSSLEDDNTIVILEEEDLDERESTS